MQNQCVSGVREEPLGISKASTKITDSVDVTQTPAVQRREQGQTVSMLDLACKLNCTAHLLGGNMKNKCVYLGFFKHRFYFKGKRRVGVLDSETSGFTMKFFTIKLQSESNSIREKVKSQSAVSGWGERVRFCAATEPQYGCTNIL